MKHFIRTLGLLGAVALSLVALPAQARDESSPITVSVTNAVPGGVTDTVGIGSAVDIRTWRLVSLQSSFTGSTTNIGNVVFTFARSVDGVKYETTPRLTWTLALNTTNEVVGITNLPIDTISGSGFLKVVSVQNTAAGGTAGSLVLKVNRKRED